MSDTVVFFFLADNGEMVAHELPVLVVIFLLAGEATPDGYPEFSMDLGDLEHDFDGLHDPFFGWDDHCNDEIEAEAEIEASDLMDEDIHEDVDEFFNGGFDPYWELDNYSGFYPVFPGPELDLVKRDQGHLASPKLGSMSPRRR